MTFTFDVRFEVVEISLIKFAKEVVHWRRSVKCSKVHWNVPTKFLPSFILIFIASFLEGGFISIVIQFLWIISTFIQFLWFISTFNQCLWIISIFIQFLWIISTFIQFLWIISTFIQFLLIISTVIQFLWIISTFVQFLWSVESNFVCIPPFGSCCWLRLGIKAAFIYKPSWIIFQKLNFLAAPASCEGCWESNKPISFDPKMLKKTIWMFLPLGAFAPELVKFKSLLQELNENMVGCWFWQ